MKQVFFWQDLLLMKSWNRYPGLYYGLAVTAGVAAYHQFWPAIFLGLLGGRHVRVFGFYLILLLSYINTSMVTSEPFTHFKTTGVGYYQCKRIRHTVSLEKGGLNYQGVLHAFVANGKTYWNIPCYITIDNHKTRPRGDQDYILEGDLIEIGHGLYRMNVESWTPVKNTWNLSEIRFFLKDRLRLFLKQHIPNKISYAFFASLGTGEIENKLISAQFAKAGLNHTLAISGFHYTWLIIALTTFFSLFFRKKLLSFFLIIFISLYFLFIGESPSLNRAWASSLIYLIGFLFGNKSIGLNALGLALLVSLTLNPKALTHIGFQMSYLATFSILALSPSVDDFLQKVLSPKRRFDAVRSMPYLHQHGYILAASIREMLALTFCVNLVTIPLNLYHFHYFPLMALFFNLFFPMGITVSLIGLIVAVVLPWVGPKILFVVDLYSQVLLDMVFWGMGKLEVGIWSHGMGVWEVGMWVMGTLLFGLFVDGVRYQLTLKRGVV